MTRPAKIAICFFGITRSLKRTHASIQEHVIGPLRALGDVMVLGHFFDQDRVVNPRSGEDDPLDAGEHRLLPFDQVVLEKPGACLLQHGYPRMLAHGDAWGDAGISLSNLVHQLHSLSQVALMAEPHHPDVVVAARPDMLYLDSFLDTVRYHLDAPQHHVSLPNWQWPRGVNDRLAVCGPEAFRAYASRLAFVDTYLRQGRGPVHSEKLLWCALNHRQAWINPVGLRARRVRANGHEVDEDFSPVSPWKKLRRLGVNRLHCLGRRPSGSGA